MSNKTASIQILNARKDKQKNKETKEARDFLDRNILETNVLLANIELIDLVKWCNEDLCNGTALHIILEKGNYEDGDIEYCKNSMVSGEWAANCEKWGYSYTTEDDKKMLRTLELLEPLTVEQREMIVNGATITEQLFDLLYNQALTGD